jgi:hypothetical protein
MTMPKNHSDLQAAEEEGLLTRWSRRKHEAKATAVNNEVPQQELTDTAVLTEPGEVVEHDEPQKIDEIDEIEAVEEYQPDDSDMPALETLDEDSDYSGFMSPSVSDELRKLALRQMFRGSMFNVRDGLDDYDDDFTKFTKLGDVVTAEMRRQIARLKAAADESSDENDPLEGSENDQGESLELSAGSSAEGTSDEGVTNKDVSELPVNAADSDGLGDSLDEKVIENEQLTEKENTGEKLYVGNN